MNRNSSLPLVLAVLLSVTLFIPGQALADNAETLLQEGVVYMRVGKFDQALKSFKRAQKKAKDASTRARILMHTGVAHGVMGKMDLAEKEFDQALRLDPTVAPSATETKRSIVELFNKVRAKIKGDVDVKADREGAIILVDGKRMGEAPMTLKLSVGKHALTVRGARELHLFKQEITVRRDDTVYINAKLKFMGGKLTVTSRPSGATVSVGGAELGSTPLKDLELTAGDHEVVLTSPGYERYARKLSLKAGGTSSMDVALEKAAVATLPAAAIPVDKPTETPAEEEKADGGSGFKWPIWTTVAAAGALAAAGAGLGLGMAASSAYDEYETTTDSARYWELRDEIPGLETGANAAFGVAGALAVTAVVLYFFVDRPAAQEADSTPEPAVAVSPSGASFSLSF